MKKILLVIGTRPEAIKLAPVIKALQKRPSRFSVKTCVTAQHREMLDQVLTLFDITPDHDLDIMAPGQNLFDVTEKSLRGLGRVYEQEIPDWVLAQGDTTTVMAAGLAAFYLKIPFGHVEAGLRTNRKYSPFPEEMNRQCASRIADLHFAPTQLSRENLIREGIAADKIFVTGNTVIDALLYTSSRQSPVGQSVSRQSLVASQNNGGGEGLTTSDYGLKTILVTAHRRENFGQGIENICHAILQIVQENSDVQVIYPVHLNPNIQTPVREFLDGQDRIQLIGPQDYEPFVRLMNQSVIILTDSGGIQEEAPSLGKPVLVLRETTERPEAVDAGTVKLVGTDISRIVNEVNTLLNDKTEYTRMAMAHNPYGDGQAAHKIVDIIDKME